MSSPHCIKRVFVTNLGFLSVSKADKQTRKKKRSFQRTSASSSSCSSTEHWLNTGPTKQYHFLWDGTTVSKDGSICSLSSLQWWVQESCKKKEHYMVLKHKHIFINCGGINITTNFRPVDFIFFNGFCSSYSKGRRKVLDLPILWLQ